MAKKKQAIFIDASIGKDVRNMAKAQGRTIRWITERALEAYMKTHKE